MGSFQFAFKNAPTHTHIYTPIQNKNTSIWNGHKMFEVAFFSVWFLRLLKKIHPIKYVSWNCESNFELFCNKVQGFKCLMNRIDTRKQAHTHTKLHDSFIEWFENVQRWKRKENA